MYPLTQTIQFRVKLYPQDFSKVRDFYEKLLGYPILNSWDGENNKGVMFDTGVAIIELLTPKAGYVPVKGVGLSLMISDVWQLWEKLQDHPNITKPFSVSSWGDAGFQIADPEGFLITFFTPESQKP